MALIYPVTTGIDLSPLPPGWRWCKLTEVARLESGHTPSRREPSYWEDGTVPWLSLKDMKNLSGKYIYQTEDMPTAKGIENSSARILPKGTVAFCRTASVGNAVILGTDMATSQDFANWVCSPAILPEYLYEALRASGAQFDKEKQGSTHKTIYMPVLENFRVLLPSLSEQHRIADILDKADAIRRKRKQAIALTDQLLRSTFLEMFGDPVTNPKGWPEASVGEVADVQGGLQVTHARENNPISVPYLRVANVFRDKIDLTEIKQIRITESEMARAILQSGDVLVVEGHGNPDELGRAAVWRAQIDPCTHQNHLIRVRPKPSIIDSHYLCSYLNSNAGRQQMLRFGNTTSGLNTISTNNVRSVSIAVPPTNLQKRFALFVSQLSKVLKSHRTAECETEALFSSLVDRAFRGELSRTEQVTGQLSMFNK